FWILLGAAALFTLVGWVVVLIGVPSQVSAEREKVVKTWEGLKKYNNFKSHQAVEAAQKQAQAFNAERAEVQKLLYKDQADKATLMTWPKGMETEGFNFRTGKYAVDVVIHPAKAEKTLPPDDDTHVAGTLTGEADEDWVEIKPRKGEA